MNNLRRWREDHGLTLAEVSGLSGYSSPELSRLERGLRDLAPLDRVKLARRLGERVEKIFPVPKDAPHATSSAA